MATGEWDDGCDRIVDLDEDERLRDASWCLNGDKRRSADLRRPGNVRQQHRKDDNYSNPCRINRRDT